VTFSIPLDGLRTLSDQFLPDSCAIQRVTRTTTENGSSSDWTMVATVACRVSPFGRSGGRETLGPAGGIQAVNQWTVWLPVGTDVRVTDRIAYGARTFEVSLVAARSYETVRACVCREVT